MPASISSVGWVDAEAARKAAERLGGMTIGARPSRTNPGGGRVQVLSPQTALANAIPRVVTFVLGRIREYTPVKTGTVRSSYNARRAFGEGSSKGSFDFVRYEVASDLPDSEQVIVSTLEYGSIPHVIRARNAKFMRIPLDEGDAPAPDAPRPGGKTGRGPAFIVDEPGGRVLYAKQVQHPGTQPHGMFRRTLEDVVPVADQVAKEVVAAVSATWPSPEKSR